MTEKLRIKADGNVGIGTSNPDAKLGVNGLIRAREVKVENSNWPDYVFNNSYELPNLSSVEAYIVKNQHLTDIPAREEVVSEGLNIGEMNALLLKKVEELTLYLIQNNKNLNIQKQENIINRRMIKRLEQQVQVLTQRQK